MADDKILDTISKKLDGVAHDVRSNSFRLDKVDARLDKVDARLDTFDKDMKEVAASLKSVGRKLDRISGQLESVVGKVIENDHRMTDVEKRVDILEASTA